MLDLHGIERLLDFQVHLDYIQVIFTIENEYIWRL